MESNLIRLWTSLPEFESWLAPRPKLWLNLSRIQWVLEDFYLEVERQRREAE
jgi:hypothetical protein